MITLITGIPGSGKSYFSVYKIYKHFLEPYLKEEPKQEKKGLFSFLKPKNNENNSNKYDVCYTNIGGFNFDISDKIKPFDFKAFYEVISILHKMKVVDDATDDELISKLKEYGYYKALIVIDEAHNYFNKKNDDVLLWLLTYHRHLFIDIDLITQNVKLISSDYSCLAQEFYKAAPPTLRIFQNKMRYTQYLDNNFFMNRVVKRFSLPALQYVFDLYISGDDTRSKSLILKIIFIFFTLCIFILIVFNFFLSSFSGSDDIPQPNQNKKHTKQSNTPHINKTLQQPKNSDLQDYYYYDVICYDNSYCKINNDEYSELSYKVFMYLKEINTPEFFEANRSQKSITRFNLVYEKDIFKFLKKGLKNEKGSHSNMLPSF